MPDRRAAAARAIEDCGIVRKLQDHSPVVVSTIFLRLDTELSDIDIVCQYASQRAFCDSFAEQFSNFDGYRLDRNARRALGCFQINGFPFEVYASSEPVASQNAYRHYRVMERLVRLGGEAFCSRVRQLKRGGLKSEPAISQLLRLDGDPYLAVIELEHREDRALVELLDACLQARR